MNVAGGTGSISRRRRPMVSLWMRARIRRSQNSSSVPAGREAAPQDVARPFQVRQGDLDRAPPHPQGVGDLVRQLNGPMHSVRLRTRMRSASSCVRWLLLALP